MSEIEFLDMRSEDEIRKALITGLTSPARSSYTIPDLVLFVYRELCPKVSYQGMYNNWKMQYDGSEALATPARSSPDSRRVLAVVWSLVSEGLLYPLFPLIAQSQPYINVSFIITEQGRRTLQAAADDPLHPSFAARFRISVKNDEILTRMEDAARCLEKRLFRPCVVMLGLVVEETIHITHDAWTHLQFVQALAPRANLRDYTSSLEAKVDVWSRKQEERHLLRMALNGAETIRVARNSCAHPGRVDLTRAIVEEHYKTVGRSMPTFWDLPISQAVAQGFLLPT